MTKEILKDIMKLFIAIVLRESATMTKEILKEGGSFSYFGFIKRMRYNDKKKFKR